MTTAAHPAVTHVPSAVATSTTHPDAPTAHRLARTAGALYLAIFVLGIFSEVVVRSSFIERGDAAATVQNLLDAPGLFRFGFLTDLGMVAADVATGVLIYLLLAPVSRAVALTAAAFRIVQSAILGANLVNHLMAIQLLEGDGLLGGRTTEQRDSLVLQQLETHRYGYFIALVFFAVHLALLAWLVHRSGYLPRWLGWFLGAAAAGYLLDSAWFFVSPSYDGAFSPVVLAPAIVAELSLILWLLVRGIDVERWDATARR
ncbi:DUF4386 domain-containing protein [Actinospongicola halichondriae]|uniref:DUF4386 domain-containing protein n=1 Tax=Actinospongicola halichondriae TaxID=3236844 RepID=UPI003D4915E8